MSIMLVQNNMPPFFFKGRGGLNSLFNWYQKRVRTLQLNAIHVNLPGIELYFLFVYTRHSHVELNTYLVVDYPTKEEITFNSAGQSFKQVKCTRIELHYIHNPWKNSKSALLMLTMYSARSQLQFFFYYLLHINTKDFWGNLTLISPKSFKHDAYFDS